MVRNFVRKICNEYEGISYRKAYKANGGTCYVVDVDFSKILVGNGWSKIDTLNDIAEMFEDRLCEGGFDSLATIGFNTSKGWYGIEIFKNRKDFGNSTVRNALAMKIAA